MPDEPIRIPLNEFLADGFKEGFGITREEAWEQGICVECKQPPRFHSEAGKREYKISGICEPCFDEMFGEEE